MPYARTWEAREAYHFEVSVGDCHSCFIHWPDIVSAFTLLDKKIEAETFINFFVWMFLFSSENLIGSGNFGSVYKGILFSDETIMAVKVLNLQ